MKTDDYNGNTIPKTDSTGNTSYTWDYENRMTSVILPGSGGTASFKYDPFGRRIYRSSSSSTSIYVYDGDNVVEETNFSGTAVARYSQGLNIDEPLAMLRTGTTSYYQAHGLGSLTSLSNTSGALANTYTYDSFGNLTASTGSLTNSFRYTGREFDIETSLYYYRARYYDPQTGRFFSEDPSMFAGGDVNFYGYAGQRPTNLIDPAGLKPGDKYKSLDCAGRDAVNDILPMTKKDGLEHGGFIYQNPDGSYSYTSPIEGTPTALPANKFFNIPVPAGTSRSGWYHTHPYIPGYNSQIFSDGDAWTSEHLNNSNTHPISGPGILGTPTNVIKKYTPVTGHPYGGKTTTLSSGPCGCS
jgi:RHS repeat-associated protein